MSSNYHFIGVSSYATTNCSLVLWSVSWCQYGELSNMIWGICGVFQSAHTLLESGQALKPKYIPDIIPTNLFPALSLLWICIFLSSSSKIFFISAGHWATLHEQIFFTLMFQPNFYLAYLILMRSFFISALLRDFFPILFVHLYSMWHKTRKHR